MTTSWWLLLLLMVKMAASYTYVSSSGCNCARRVTCAKNNGGCSADAACTNIEGGVECNCNNGFHGDGFQCEDIDECARNGVCGRNAECSNTKGSFKCTCKPGFTGDGRTCTPAESTPAGKPRNCYEIYKAGKRTDGEYRIHLSGMQDPVNVYCDMTTDGGGWTVFQRRKDGTANFYRCWKSYKKGFGRKSGEFWLGNRVIHLLTNDGCASYELRIDLEDFSGRSSYAEYDNFKIGSEYENYKLSSLGTYKGTAGDALRYHLNTNFGTADRKNNYKCSKENKGGFWFGDSDCNKAFLNGKYQNGPETDNGLGIIWDGWPEYDYSLKFTEMKIRPGDSCQ